MLHFLALAPKPRRVFRGSVREVVRDEYLRRLALRDIIGAFLELEHEGDEFVPSLAFLEAYERFL